MAYANPSAGKRRADIAETAIVSLTAASGTANNVVVDVTASPTQALINDNFKDVASKINEILVELRKAGIIAP